MKQEEIWRPAPGFVGVFEISNLGRVKSLSRITKNGNGFRIVSERIRKQNRSKKLGYPQVTLRLNGCHKRIYIHRLVAEAFLDNPLKKPQVNHIDGCKWNNHIDNLEWVTSSENLFHAHEIGLKKGVWRGKLAHNSIGIIAIKDMAIQEFSSITAFVKEFKISVNTFYKAIREGVEINGHLIYSI